MTDLLYTSQFTDENGCLVLYDVHNKFIIQDLLNISRVKINKCTSLHFSKLRIVGKTVNKSLNNFTPSIQILRSSDCIFNNIIIRGKAILNIHSKDKVKARSIWNKYVQSGIDNRGNRNTFHNISMLNVHDGIINKGNDCEFNGVNIEKFSGDAFFNSGNRNVYVNLSSDTPLKSLPYRLKHRDIFQLAVIDGSSKSEISDVSIFGLTHNDGNTNHILYKPTDGGLIHTDGILSYFNANDISIISDIDFHGISSVCLRHSTIKILTLKTKNPENDIVHLEDRKGIGKSYQNSIEFIS